MKNLLNQTTKSKRVFVYLLAYLFAVSCNAANSGNQQNKSTSSATKTNSNATSGSFLKMKLAAITDNQVTKGNAILFLLPEGWQQKSRLDWDAQNTMFPASGELHVNNPDNSAQLHIYKTSFYTLANQAMYKAGIGLGSKYMGGKVVANMPATTIQATMQTLKEMNVLPADLKIIETKVNKVESTNPLDIQAMKQNPQVQFISDNVISKGVITKNGENYTVLINAYVNGTINKSMDFSNWQVLPIVFFIKQDADEKRNTELCQAVLKSIRYTPAFTSAQQQVIKYLSDQFYQGVRNIAAISQQISRNNDAMIASIDKSYSQANASYKSSSSTDGFSQYIRGVENYSDESGSTYELPSSYQQAWKGSNGEIILSNTNDFNPNQNNNTNNQNWEELKK
ncbi:MAG: hypothetical protein U0T69_14360 [Chitinophagales bacterium]